ncbi:MAG: hypothetical protein ACYSWP_25080, partial [Planctomycetota bacterium]
CTAVENRGAWAVAGGRLKDLAPWSTLAVGFGHNTRFLTSVSRPNCSEGNKGVHRHEPMDGNSPTDTGR